MAAGDYRITCTNNVNAGTAAITVAGVGNYCGTIEKGFRILPADLSKCTVAAIPDQTCTGAEIVPALNVTNGSMTLTSGVDYTVVYSNNIAVGTAGVKLSGMGNYTGTKEITFCIVENSVTPPVSDDPQQPVTPPVSDDPQQPVTPPVSDDPQQPVTPPASDDPQQPVTPPVSDDPQQPVTPPVPEQTATQAELVVGTTARDTVSGADYRITQPGASGVAEVEYMQPAGVERTSVVIPDTVIVNGVICKVTSIAPNAFKNNKKLRKVSIGSNVIEIGANAFSGCKKLGNVVLGVKVGTIKARAFYNCRSLKKITIPANVTEIGKQAFANCKKLQKITIKTTKLKSKTVGSKAFKGINKKVSIKVPGKSFKAYKKLLRKKGVSTKAKIRR